MGRVAPAAGDPRREPEMALPATVAVPRPLLVPIWFAAAAAVVFLAVAAIVGVFRPGYDPWHQAVSALSLGPGGWMQTLNFAVFGAAILGTVPAWRRILAGRTGATAYPLLTALTGSSLVAAGLLPQDPAPGYDPLGLALERPTSIGLLHLAVAGVAAASSVGAIFVMAARFAELPQWRAWALYSRITGTTMIACVAVYAVWSTHATGFAGTFERMVVVIPTCWGLLLVTRLWLGVPFMETHH